MNELMIRIIFIPTTDSWCPVHLGLVHKAIRVSRGKRKTEAHDDLIPFIPDPVENNKALRKNWARLIQKIGACPGEGRES
jgi:hypothetical protein